jgi:hypothetical protein
MVKEMKTDKSDKCRECGTQLFGKNAIDVGYCIPCFNIMMSDDEEEEDEEDFEPCDECDGHDACEDFGCAIKAGLGHLLNNPI